MNRKLVLTLAVSGALAGLAGGVYAQEAPKPEDEKPQLQQLVSQLEIALPWFIAEGDEDKKPEQPQLIAGSDDPYPDQGSTPELIADSHEKPEAPKPELIAGTDDSYPDQGSTPELIAEGEDTGDSKPELIA